MFLQNRAKSSTRCFCRAALHFPLLKQILRAQRQQPASKQQKQQHKHAVSSSFPEIQSFFLTPFSKY